MYRYPTNCVRERREDVEKKKILALSERGRVERQQYRVSSPMGADTPKEDRSSPLIQARSAKPGPLVFIFCSDSSRGSGGEISAAWPCARQLHLQGASSASWQRTDLPLVHS